MIRKFILYKYSYPLINFLVHLVVDRMGAFSLVDLIFKEGAQNATLDAGAIGVVQGIEHHYA
jgi:hypothetical protein